MFLNVKKLELRNLFTNSYAYRPTSKASGIQSKSSLSMGGMMMDGGLNVSLKGDLVVHQRRLQKFWTILWLPDHQSSTLTPVWSLREA